MLWRVLAVICVVALAGCQPCCPGKAQLAEPLLAPAPLGDQVSPLGVIEGVPPMIEGEAPASQIRQHSYQSVGSVTDPSVDASGKWMVFSSTAHSIRPDIFIKAVDGKTLTQLTTDPASDIQPAFSPDGRNVAFASNRTGVWEIYVMSVDGKTVRQITQGGGQNLHPSWSPDGRRLVYCCQSARSGQWELWIADLASPAGRQLIGLGLFPVWSPKEDLIAYQRARGRGDQLYGIWTIRLDQGEPSPPTLVAAASDAAYVGPAFSADGRQLAFAVIDLPAAQPADPNVVAPETSTDIFVVDINGENLRRLTQGPGRKFSPTWAPGRIFFCCNRGGYENIWSVQADFSRVEADLQTVLGAIFAPPDSRP